MSFLLSGEHTDWSVCSEPDVSDAPLSAHAAAEVPRDRSDEQLLAGIANGERSAMEKFYVRHQQRVYRFVLRLVNNTANAEDLTSETFLTVWQQARTFEGRSQISTWLLSIARYK